MKKTLTILILWGIPCAALLFYIRGNDGFFATSIYRDVSDARWKVQNDPVSSILSQPFYYLGKGAQSFVFESADHQFVIKFFKKKHLENHFWHTSAQRQRHTGRKELLFSGCLLAFNRMKEECGLVYMHLTNEHIEPQFVTLIDKLGMSHAIDLQRAAFYVQKKGEAIGDLSHYCAELQHLIQARNARGITDRDPALQQNLALLNGHLFFIDVGQFELANYSSKDMLVSSTSLVQ